MADPTEICRAAGTVILGGFDGIALPDDFAADLRAQRLGGAILFRRNLEALEPLVALTRSLHDCRPTAAPALPVSIDQEGGRVARLRGLATDLPPAAWLGAIGDPELCTRTGEVVASELWALGFNLDYAPVMDVHTEPSNPVIGDRAFGSDPERVARLAGAFALGLLVGGVAPCAKHFPGHGDTTVDSHLDLPVVEHDLERLRAVEWVPFRAAVRGGIPLIMTAHVLLPALDPEHPATFSPRVLDEQLRGYLGFAGVIVSDDLEMAAVTARYPIEDMGPLGLLAGVDLFLVGHSRERQRAVYESLVRAAESDAHLRDRLLESARRVNTLRAQFLRTPPVPETGWQTVVGCAEHRAVADEIRRRHGELAGVADRSL